MIYGRAVAVAAAKSDDGWKSSVVNTTHLRVRKVNGGKWRETVRKVHPSKTAERDKSRPRFERYGGSLTFVARRRSD